MNDIHPSFFLHKKNTRYIEAYRFTEDQIVSVYVLNVIESNISVNHFPISRTDVSKYCFTKTN